MSVASQSPRSRVPFADSALDLPALGAALWRKKWTILRPTILVALGTLVVVQVMTPKYQSESRVFIEGRDNIYLRPDADRDTTDRGAVDQEAVTSQAQIILSRDLAREVIEKLKLNERPEFDTALRGISPIRSVLGLLGLMKDPLSMTPEERVLEAYYERLTVVPIEKSRVITIDFLSEDPQLAARVANAIADGYLVRQREAKQEQARSAGQWLSGEIDSMRVKVEAAEAKVEDFRAKSGLLVGTNNTTLSAQQLGDVNAQLTAARAQKSDAETKAKLIREMLRSGQPIESSDILNSELVRRLAEQRVTLRAQLAEQSSTLLDGHPRIKELKAQIADLDSQIRAEAETVARSFENDSKLAGARADAMTASLDQLKNQAASTNGQDVQLRALERDAKSQRDLLESYLAKYREASSRDTLNSTPADARVISRATVSNIPAYPKKLPAVLIASFATLILCSGLVLTREILAAGPIAVAPPPPLEPTVDAPEGFVSRMASFGRQTRHVEPRAFGGAPAASVPPESLPLSSAADVAHSLQRRGISARVAVIGATPAVNTSQAAIKLARALAGEYSVVLIGLASDDSAIRAISNEPSAGGLAELAAGAVSFGDVITKDRLSPLHVITSGRMPSDRISILTTPGMTTKFEALARSYDYVIVDVGDMGGAALDRISEFAPNALLVADTPTGVATASARERLLVAGFSDVTLLSSGRGIAAATAVAA